SLAENGFVLVDLHTPAFGLHAPSDGASTAPRSLPLPLSHQASKESIDSHSDCTAELLKWAIASVCWAGSSKANFAVIDRASVYSLIILPIGTRRPPGSSSASLEGLPAGIRFLLSISWATAR